MRKPFYGHQAVAKQCYLTTISTKVAINEVHLVKEELEVLKDVGRILENKGMEDLIRYKLNEPSSNHYILVDLNMKEQERVELIKFLKANIEVFV